VILALSLLACGDEGDDLAAECSSYCAAVCDRLVGCTLTADAGACTSACRSWSARDRMPAITCSNLMPMASMECDSLAGWSRLWFTKGWHEFPDYSGWLRTVENTCVPDGFDAEIKLDVYIYRGKISFLVTSAAVVDPDDMFLGDCTLSSDGSCTWHGYFETWDGPCKLDKTDTVTMDPAVDGCGGLGSVEYAENDGDCTNTMFLTLPCIVRWDIVADIVED